MRQTRLDRQRCLISRETVAATAMRVTERTVDRSCRSAEAATGAVSVTAPAADITGPFPMEARRAMDTVSIDYMDAVDTNARDMRSSRITVLCRNDAKGS